MYFKLNYALPKQINKISLSKSHEKKYLKSSEILRTKVNNTKGLDILYITLDISKSLINIILFTFFQFLHYFEFIVLKTIK